MGFGGSLLGGVIGWAVGGPIGGLVGSFIGGTVTRSGVTPSPAGTPPQGEGASAAIALVVLMAAVTRADKRVSRGEVSYVRQFLVRSFGADNAADLMQVYKRALDKDLDLAPICSQVRAALDPAGVSQLIHALIGLVQADDLADESEIRLVRKIAGLLGVSGAELSRIEAMYWHDETHAYQVLGASTDDSMAAIKTKYRELVKQYHPDKVSHLGEEFRELAKTKFVQIQEAYETVEKGRGGK